MKQQLIAPQMYDAYLHELPSDMRDHLSWLLEHSYGNVVEIGLRAGVSTSALLCGVEIHGGHVWSIDRTEDCVTFDNLRWTFLFGDSRRNFRRLLAQLPDHFDLLLVDGDHSYDGCLFDLLNYGHRADVIAVHDTDSPDYPGVMQAAATYFRNQSLFSKLEFIKPSFGMGVFTR